MINCNCGASHPIDCPCGCGNLFEIVTTILVIFINRKSCQKIFTFTNFPSKTDILDNLKEALFSNEDDASEKEKEQFLYLVNSAPDSFFNYDNFSTHEIYMTHLNSYILITKTNLMTTSSRKENTTSN